MHPVLKYIIPAYSLAVMKSEAAVANQIVIGTTALTIAGVTLPILFNSLLITVVFYISILALTALTMSYARIGLRYIIFDENSRHLTEEERELLHPRITLLIILMECVVTIAVMILCLLGCFAYGGLDIWAVLFITVLCGYNGPNILVIVTKLVPTVGLLAVKFAAKRAGVEYDPKEAQRTFQNTINPAGNAGKEDDSPKVEKEDD